MAFAEAHPQVSEQSPTATYGRKIAKVALLLSIYPGVGIAGGVAATYLNIHLDQAHLRSVQRKDNLVIAEANNNLEGLREAVGAQCANAMGAYGIMGARSDVPLEGATQQLVYDGSCLNMAGGNLQAAVAELRTEQQAISANQAVTDHAERSLRSDMSLSVGGLAGFGIETGAIVGIAMLWDMTW